MRSFVLAVFTVLLCCPFTLANTRMPAFDADLIADITQRVAPSVVNIDIERSTAPAGLPPGFHTYFQQFLGGNNNGGKGSFKTYQTTPNTHLNTMRGNGSGVILDTAGHILTNSHVVRQTQHITVTLQDGRNFPAQVVGDDSYTDLALLKINAPNLQPARLGNSDELRAGDWVLAIGSPHGFDHTVTLGIVSGISRKIPDLNTNMSYIQTDAAINDGNSGGPLVNLRGEVVGINTAVLTLGQNMGFAIPINIAGTIQRHLKSQGRVTRPTIGLGMVQVTPSLAEKMGYQPDTTGVVVAAVQPDSPAQQAGLLEGDIIQQVNRHRVQQPADVQRLVQQLPLGSQLSLKLLRKGKRLKRNVTTQALSLTPPATPPKPNNQPLPNNTRPFFAPY